MDPFPFELDMAELRDAHIAGRSVSVRVEHDAYEVTIEGERYKRPLGDPLRIDW